MMNTDILITIGSRAFFEGMEGFHPKDTDLLILQAKPSGYRYVKQIHMSGRCIYYWRLMAGVEYIDYALQKGPAMQVGKFLVPEFARVVGISVSDIQRLHPLIDRLDRAHHYERLIYESYVANGTFSLSTVQRSAAFAEYKKFRP